MNPQTKVAGLAGPALPAGEPPLGTYQRLISACDAGAQRLGRGDTGLVWARLLVFAAGVVALVLAARGRLALTWPLLAAGVFVALVLAHARLLGRLRRLRAARVLYTAGVARIADRWSGQGDPGTRFQAAAEEHLYAADLDLYGTGGLYELLCSARTPIGQTTLARWLESPAPVAVVRGRQGAVAELARRLDLREELALAATVVKDEVRGEALTAWATEAPAGLPPRLGGVRLVLAAAAAATLAAAVLWAAGAVGPWPFAALFAAGWLLSRRLAPAVERVVGNVEHRAAELGTLAAAMARLERESFTAPALSDLQRALQTEGVPPSRRIAQLRRLVDLLDGRRNQLMALLLAPLQATAQLALAIEAWRRATGPAVVRWMAAVGELEALSSLATFAFEHPHYPFPEVLEAPAEPPLFEGAGLGHPLIPTERRVVNDVQIGGARRLLVVSGSNMSGKSTLLRTVGVNAVLALAGAPVCAQRLVLSPITIGATLRINDSLQAGKSRFYAELTRLKLIVDRAGKAPPLLFLLDEILHGTNSHDRRIGAEAIIRGLIARGAVGLVTTHDLALAEVADALAPRAANVHFEDHLEAGVMTFDYRMKPGVVRKSNALALMRAVGLEV